MKRAYYLLALLLLFTFSSFAQSDKIVLLIKPDATSISFRYRLGKEGDEAFLDLGKGETTLLKQTKQGQLEVLNYTFKSVSSETRTLTLSSDQLVTLRLTGAKSIEGVLIEKAPLLERFNCDFIPLDKSEKIDFSQCPKLQEITLNGAEVSSITLPEDPSKIKTIQWATPLVPLPHSRQLQSLDLSHCTALEDLSLQGTSLQTIDLSDCPNLKQLVIKGLSSKAYPRVLLGAKKLTKLTRVVLQFCAFSYDMLPDLNETQLDKFQVNKMYYAHLDKSHYRGMCVDLSHLAFTKGISATPVETEFKWYYKDANKKWKEIPEEKIKKGEKKGIFIFEDSLLDPATKKITIRAKIFNAGYPNLNFYKGGLFTYNITLPNNPTTLSFDLTKESPGKNEDGEDIDELDISLQLGASKDNTPISIDWGNGQPVSYTIPKATEPYTVSQKVDLGSHVKIYGPIALFDATNSKITGIKFEEASSLKVVRLSRNKIEKIDLTPLKNLIELQITDNKLSSLDLSSVTQLEELYCGYNKLTSLLFEKTPRLSVLNCNNNQITNIDFKTLPQLEIVRISGNSFPKSLDLTPCTKLRTIDIEQCGLSSIKLNSENLERFKGRDNRLKTFALTPKIRKASHLYDIDLANNLMEACDLNDLVATLKTPRELNVEKATLRVKGNPGAKSYDGEFVRLWEVDEKGNAQGCETAKIFDISTTKNGRAYLEVGEKKNIPLGTPLKKRVGGSIILVPNEGYLPAYCKWGESKLTPEDKSSLKYLFVLSKNEFVSYDFKKGSSNITISQNGNRWSFCPTTEGFEIGTPFANSTFTLYSLAGDIVAKGITNSEGIASLVAPRGNYVFRVADISIKLLR